MRYQYITSHRITSHGVNDRVCCCLNVAARVRVEEYDLRRLLTSLPPPLPVPEHHRHQLQATVATTTVTAVLLLCLLLLLSLHSSHRATVHIYICNCTYIHTYMHVLKLSLFSTLSRFNCLSTSCSSCEVSATDVITVVVVIKQINIHELTIASV